MSKELIQKKLFTRRAIVLGACKTGLLAGLFGRMFYLQILNRNEFTKLAENNHIKTEIIPPLRGKILDRSGIPLALNQQKYQLVFSKSTIHTPEIINEIGSLLNKILNLSPDDLAELLNDLSEVKLDSKIIIAENLNWSQLISVEIHLYDLPGVNIEIGFDRFYPHATTCCHLTGYVGTISDKEILKSSIALYPDLKIGKNGIEKTQEELLHGTTGIRRIEVNAKGEIIREISTHTSKKGDEVNLTIDVNLQNKASKLLGNESGVILAAKIDTGEILASVSHPTFDPNLFNNGISLNEWNKLINNPEIPLINRAVSLTYPPGSGFKINVAIAALKEKFDPKTIFFCPGYFILGDRTFHCWKKDGHGAINLHQAIAGSCNCYFWNVAKIIGFQSIANLARKMGYGSKLLNNTLPREQSGIIPDDAWKKQHVGTSWNIADTINCAIGQGYVEATPIQILTMVSRIASGREFIPTIIKPANQQEFASLELDKELKIVREGMEMVVNSNIGTAYLNRIIDPNLAMAGKTGTSQVISKRHANDDLSKYDVTKKIKNHGIFVSYAPIINPKYAFCGIIEHGGTPALAVKIAKEILSEMQLKNL